VLDDSFVLRAFRAPDQNWATCFVIAAVACTRARPATEFAPLGHILINGFFFIHGFGIEDSGLELSRITLFDGAESTVFDGLPASASRLL
jgi:hypothetical protein